MSAFDRQLSMHIAVPTVSRLGRSEVIVLYALASGGTQQGHPFEYGKAGRGTNKYPKINGRKIEQIFDIFGFFN